MSEVDANPEVGAETEAQSFDAVAAFSNMLDQANQPQPEPEGDSEEVYDDQPEEEPEAKPEEEERKIKVKVSGEEIEVPESEAANGYMRDADYRNKTKQLAEMRREVEAQFQQVQQVVQTDRQQLQEAAQFFMSQLPQVSPPDPNLIDTEPTKYMRQKELFERVTQQRQMAMAALQQTKQKEVAEQEMQRNSILAQGDQMLSEVIPQWKNPEGKQQIRETIKSFYQYFGVKPETLGNIYDPGLILSALASVSAFEKAQKYDELMAKTQSSNKRVQSLPPRAERPGRGTTNAQDGRTEAMRALKRSGRTEDAAAIFSKML